MPQFASLAALARANWQAGVTVALISVPLSIALSIASGAGPVPGIITGIWATLIASIFGGSNYNIIGAAGALTTVLFAATVAAPLGLGAAILPLLALATGLIILAVWAVGADRFLYYIPASVMYGFAAGVAFLIAASQLFDATGLSTLKRTGTFVGDISLYAEHAAQTHLPTVVTFAAFLAATLVWKRLVPKVPAVIPVALAGIAFGYIEHAFIAGIDLVTLGDKFGSFSAALTAPVAWSAIPQLAGSRESIEFIASAAGLIALIAVLETLITAKIGDRITKTQSSSRRELLGLALANLGSGAAGGLPATGVFIRTGANIKAGATHRMAAAIAAAATAGIALMALPFFTFIPMAVIAAILTNTALGLIETHKFIEFWQREKQSFAIATLVALVTVFEDAGLAVLVGSVAALLWFANRISHGKFDLILNYADGTTNEVRGAKTVHIPHDAVVVVATYSIAGFLGYIDAARHAANLRHLARSAQVGAVIIRLRDLYALDAEGADMLAEAAEAFSTHGKPLYITTPDPVIRAELLALPAIAALAHAGAVKAKASDALAALRGA